MNKNNGKLIVFEGADDLGKTTQIDLLYNYLSDNNYKVIKTREPGGTNLGSRLRNLILNSKEKMPSKTELFLFLADRNYHYEKVLKPKLEEGYIILCDRFYLSTLVYQHKLGNLKEEYVKNLNLFSTNGLKPNLSFVFYGKRLTKNIKDEYEKFILDNHNALNRYYRDYALKDKNSVLIDANKPIKEVFYKIKEIVLSY